MTDKKSELSAAIKNSVAEPKNFRRIIGEPHKINQKNIEIINKTKINNHFIKNNNDFRETIIKQININDEVLDVGKSMRGFFDKIKSKSIITLDVNEFEDYPDIVFDLCDELPENLNRKFDKIICIAILEHVYNPFKAVGNLKKMLKENGTIYGYVPYLYKYHAPNDLMFQDYFRFSKDALSYLFKDFHSIELFPVRGRISAPLNIVIPNILKKFIEKLNINLILDKISSDRINGIQCSGYNFIVKK